jgi:redox-sensing transcriptional repressor
MIYPISKQTLQRLPLYLSYLKTLGFEYGSENISATTIANALRLNQVQVRKDLASISSSGKPKIGYNIQTLIVEIESFLGYDNINEAVIVGAGRLGTALLTFQGFKEYGLDILAAFDSNPEKLGMTDCNKPILPVEELKEMCLKFNIRIGIITTPAKCAQQVCDLLVESGIQAIWNFAPVHLIVPPNILVQNENMATSLAVLSNHLTERIKNGEEKNGTRSDIREK